MEATWAVLISDGLIVQALTDVLPLEATRDGKTVQHHTLTVALRWEAEWGEEPWAFVEHCPADGPTLPIPDGSHGRHRRRGCRAP